jgi:spermidine/putrescine transport system substrate-binding protein
MLTKLRTNPGAYDLVVLNAARCAQAVAEDLLQPIDFSQGSERFATVDDNLRSNPNFSKDGKGFAVPWVWGMTSLAIREGMAGSRQLRRSGRSHLSRAASPWTTTPSSTSASAL